MTSSPLLATLVLPAVTGLIVGFSGGLIAGFSVALCWITRHSVRGGGVPIYHEETNPNPGHRPWRGREHFSKLGWVLAVLGLLGFMAGVVSLVQNNQTSACLAEFVANNAASTRGRAEAAAIDRQAIRQQRQITLEFNQIMIDAVTHPATDPAAQAKAREDFLAKAKDWNTRLAEVDRLDQQAEAQRQANPLPLQPAC